MIIKLISMIPVAGPWLAAALSFSMSRVGSTIIIAISAYLFGDYVGGDRERTRIEIAAAAETARLQNVSREVTEKSNARTEDANKSAEKVESEVNDYVREQAQKPLPPECMPTDADIAWMRKFSPSYRGVKPATPSR